MNISVFVISSLLAIMFSLLSGSYLIADWFTGVGFDDSVFYHLDFGVEGTGIVEFIPQILLFVSIQVLFLIGIVLYSKKTIRSKIKYKTKNIFLGFLMVISAFFCNPATSNLISYLYDAESSADFASYFVKPQIKLAVEKPKNILYFYLESMERNYMNEDLFPGLLPELHKIESEGMSYTNIGQAVGGSWTMAGMVSSQCGLPLLSLYTNNNFYMKTFMPNVTCLGDILKSEGYHLEYMGGADIKFAGKGLFYKNHGFDEVKGKNEFLHDGESSQYTNDWGLFDDSLYSLLMDRVKKLHKEKKPWGVFSINIGTHQPEGFLARACNRVKYGDGKDKLLNAVHCTDKLIGDIYRQLKQSGVLDDTLVIFGSDHFAPPMVKPYKTLSKVERHNLLIFTGAGIKPGFNTRAGTTLDVAPTVLNYLHLGSQPVGLGRDLNGSSPTLKEEFKYQKLLDSKLLSWRSVIDTAFWGYPKLENQIQIETQSKNIIIGNKKIRYPSLLSYDAEGNIKNVIYGSDDISGDNRYLPAFHLAGMVNEQLFLWVDKCNAISTLNHQLKQSGDEYCFYNGSLGSELSSGVISTKGKIVNIAKSVNSIPDIARANALRHELKDKNLVKWDDYQWQYSGKYAFPLFFIQAPGRNSLVTVSDFSGMRPEKPGLRFVRFSYHYDNKSGNSYHTDIITDLSTCDDVIKGLDFVKNIKEPPVEKSYTTLFYALAGNVNKKCQSNIQAFSGKYNLNKLQALSTGSSYISLFDERKRIVYEKSGRPDETIAVSILFKPSK